jgi:transposase
MSGFPLDSSAIFKYYERKSLIIADRSVQTVSAWFEERPSVEIVSRDRSSEYAAAISKGAPQALQVADLWHIVKNLSESVQTLLARGPGRNTTWFANTSHARARASRDGTRAGRRKASRSLSQRQISASRAASAKAGPIRASG